MLYAKFQDHRTTGPGEKHLKMFLSYMDVAAILVMYTGPFIQNLVPLSH